jgi:hypothetical protein
MDLIKIFIHKHKYQIFLINSDSIIYFAYSYSLLLFESLGTVQYLASTKCLAR